MLRGIRRGSVSWRMQLGKVGVPLVAAAALLCMILFASGTVHAGTRTTKFWLQTMDSCQQAIPGASFVLQGGGLSIPKGPAAGAGSLTIGTVQGECPLQRGDCSTTTTGCLSWDIPVPASGTQVYTIKETAAPNGYAPCTGGSVCTGGPVVVILTIDASGAITATASNIYPDGTSVSWPTKGDPYKGTSTDPVVVHNSAMGKDPCGKSDGNGSPSSHCDPRKKTTPTPTSTPTKKPTPTPTSTTHNNPAPPPKLPQTGSNPGSGLLP